MKKIITILSKEFKEHGKELKVILIVIIIVDLIVYFNM